MTSHDRYALSFAGPKSVGTAVVSRTTIEEQLLRVLGDEAEEHLDTLCARLMKDQMVVRGKITLWIRRLTPDVLGDGELGLSLARPRIAQLLDDAGLSNGEVAAGLSTTTITVSRWRSGRVVPPVTSALRLAAFVGVPVEAIDWSLNDGVEIAKVQGLERGDAAAGKHSTEHQEEAAGMEEGAKKIKKRARKSSD